LKNKKLILIIGTMTISFFAMIALHYKSHYSILTFLSGWLFLVSSFALLFRNKKGNYLLAIFSLLLMFLLIEVFFRFAFKKELSAHSESNSSRFIKKYVSIYHRENETYLYNGKRNISYCVAYKEFQHCRDFNENGIPHSKSIEPWLPSILFLGDSFTEGIGAPEDSTFVTEMWNKLNRSYNCINGGMAGSDVFYEWALYKSQLEVLKPKAIVFLLNSTDISDVIIRGGEERFNANAQVKKGPFWEPFYASSFAIRKFATAIGYNWLLLSTKKNKQEYLAAIQKLREKVNAIYIENENAGIATFFVLHPSDIECRLNQYDFKLFTEILVDIPLKAKVNTLTAFYDNNLCDKIYWTYDRHFNPKGYNILAEVVYNNLGTEMAKVLRREITY
jgi:hypothetical protein